MILSWDRLESLQKRPPSLWRAFLVKLWWWGYDFRDLFATWACAQPSHRLRRFMLRLSGMSIGRDSSVHKDCILLEPSGIKLAPNCVINDNVVLDGRGKLTIGRNVSISRQAAIYTADHDIDTVDFALRRKPVVIEDYVFIGTRATILPGVTIGRGAVIAAGALVTRDVGELDVVAGVPANFIRKRACMPTFQLKYWKLWA